jgi:serine/threonine protein kinase
MSLAPGTRIGLYEVVALIGAGGMGEVYRARDTQLDRDVAIKILPELFSADADRVARKRSLSWKFNPTLSGTRAHGARRRFPPRHAGPRTRIGVVRALWPSRCDPPTGDRARS